MCQNPSHSHHHSHHRFLVADTVVEESTGGSIVTVISNSTMRANDSTPDIILTHSDTENEAHNVDDHLSHAARSLSIKSIDQQDETIENASPSSSTVTTAPATEQTSNNNNEAGTDSIQINSFSFEQFMQTHHYGFWIRA